MTAQGGRRVQALEPGSLPCRGATAAMGKMPVGSYPEGARAARALRQTRP